LKLSLLEALLDIGEIGLKLSEETENGMATNITCYQLPL